MHRLEAKQFLPITVEQAWEFISNPKNLQLITPPEMKFHIIAGADKPLFSGQIIHYQVSPLPFYRTGWTTEITQVEPGKYFIDTQLRGPYSIWHHKHFLYETEGGVLMEDVIDYQLPLGFIGRLLDRLFVRKQLRTIFNFRKEAMEARYGNLEGKPASLTIKTI